LSRTLLVVGVCVSVPSKTWRTTIIPVVAIPRLFARIVHRSLRVPGYRSTICLSLGLVLAVGIVVDDAIVVVEKRGAQHGVPACRRRRPPTGRWTKVGGSAALDRAGRCAPSSVPAAFPEWHLPGLFFPAVSPSRSQPRTVIFPASSHWTPQFLPCAPCSFEAHQPPLMPRRCGTPRSACFTQVFDRFNRGFDGLSHGYGKFQPARLARGTDCRFS